MDPMTKVADRETTYRVQSLERGLGILRELRRANAPVRNQELATRTRLPKATVSRLLNTLGALGYVRRTDQGTYVLAHGSARSGRAMLASLGLERYQPLFAGAPGPVVLQARVGDRLVPVHRWPGPRPGAGGFPAALAVPDGDAGGAAEHWDAEAGIWSVWTGLDLHSVGSFALTLQVAQRSDPTRAQLDEGHAILRRAAAAMTSGAPS
jgi:hypothetical protein